MSIARTAVSIPFAGEGRELVVGSCPGCFPGRAPEALVVGRCSWCAAPILTATGLPLTRHLDGCPVPALASAERQSIAARVVLRWRA